MRKIRCAVLGGTGNVGQRFIKMIDDHPFFDISLIIASKRNEGKQYIDAVHWLMKGDIPSSIQHMKIRTFNIDIFKKMNVDIVFSALTLQRMVTWCFQTLVLTGLTLWYLFSSLKLTLIILN